MVLHAKIATHTAKEIPTQRGQPSGCRLDFMSPDISCSMVLMFVSSTSLTHRYRTKFEVGFSHEKAGVHLSFRPP